MIHPESGFKANIYPASKDPLHQRAFKNRCRESMEKKLKIWFSPPEYVIIKKLDYFREGGREKHLDDIRKMLPQILNNLDRTFLEKEIQQCGFK